MIAPNTNITLLKTPMELSDSNTLSFSSETAKYNYFNSLSKLTLDNATYQRKDGVVRFPTNSNTTFEDLLKYNYCMYQNTSYDNKWFYAYVIDVKYINDGMCEIKLKTDSFMTWQNSITFKRSFVERAHVADDTPGKHTIPENLELGEYIINSVVRDNSNNNLKLVMASTVVPSDPELASSGGLYNGVYSAIGYYTYDVSNMNSFIQDIVGNNKSDAIQSVFLAPEWLLPQAGGGVVEHTATPLVHSISVTPMTQLDGYTPKNGKLLTYPYIYLLGSNMNGGSAVYKQEFFTLTNNVMLFMIFGVLSPGCSIKMVPTPYNGITNNFDEGLVLGKYPQCNWVTDMFTNWATQQGVNVGIQGAVGLGETLTGFATENPALAVKGFTAVASAVNQVRVASMVPPQFKGSTNGSDVITASGENRFAVYSMSIRKEYAKIIDDYFSMFGYAINRVEPVNYSKRRYWDYIKTIGCNIIGDIPQEDMTEIRNLFDNGLTVWHDPAHFLDYSLTNSIVS